MLSSSGSWYRSPVVTAENPLLTESISTPVLWVAETKNAKAEPVRVLTGRPNEEAYRIFNGLECRDHQFDRGLLDVFVFGKQSEEELHIGKGRLQLVGINALGNLLAHVRRRNSGLAGFCSFSTRDASLNAEMDLEGRPTSRSTSIAALTGDVKVPSGTNLTNPGAELA